MAIHKNDDYEKLAKLFYPSIEASGNVYYGQTRKLTMDEVLGKNDFGFESHIESFRVDDDNEDYGFKYINCLCWKLGPLSDTITLDDDNYPLEGMYGYAKYKLIVSDNTRNNLLYSNNFNTYEKNVRIEFLEVSRIEDGKAPYGNDPYDGRCFYVQNAPDLENYLYIPITLDHFEESESDDEGGSGSDIPTRSPLYIKAVEGSLAIKIAPSHGFSQEEINNLSGVYLYKVGNDQDWQEITDFENDEIHLSQNQFVYFRCTSDRFIPEFTNQKFVQFLIEDLGNSGKAEVGGNLNSIRQYASPYGYFRLFGFCDTIISAENLIINNTNGAAKYYCAEMFLGCTNLVKPPRYISTVAELSHRAMFRNCSSLIRSPMLNQVKVAFGCYFEMFDGCTSLAKLWCSAKSVYLPRELHIQDPRLDLAVGPYNVQSNVPTLHSINVDGWLDSASQTGDFYCTNNVQPVGRPRPVELPDYWEDLVPEGWSPKVFNSTEFFNEEVVETPVNEDQDEDELLFTPKYKRDYLITSGSASEISYGRGDITKKETKYSMKKINPLYDPDAPKIGEYNKDGSYNQDIWGWKCFNGPVSFRNGIYGENGCIISGSLSGDDVGPDDGNYDGISIFTASDDFYYHSSVELGYSADHRDTIINITSASEKPSDFQLSSTAPIGISASIDLQSWYRDDSDYGSRIALKTNEVILGKDDPSFTGTVITSLNILPMTSLDSSLSRVTLGDSNHYFGDIYAEHYHGLFVGNVSGTATYARQLVDSSNNSIITANASNARVYTNLIVDGNINANSDILVAGSVDISNNLTVNGFLNQHEIQTHKLTIINDRDDTDDSIIFGEIDCHGNILTYQSIKPFIRILRPSAETITALNDGYPTYTAEHAYDDIYQVLDDNPTPLGLGDKIIKEIIDTFKLGEDYYLPGNIVLSTTLKNILTGPISQIGITHICTIEPENYSEEGESLDSTIGLPDHLEASYNGYFSTITSLNAISDNSTIKKLNVDIINVKDVTDGGSVRHVDVDKDVGEYIPKAEITFNQSVVDEDNEFTVTRNACITAGSNIASNYFNVDEDLCFTFNDDTSFTRSYYTFTENSFYAESYDGNGGGDVKSDLGTSDYPWNTLYTDSISCTNNIECWNILPINTDPEMVNFPNIGSELNKFGSIYLHDNVVANTVKVGSSIVSAVSTESGATEDWHPSIGTERTPFSDIWAQRLHGSLGDIATNGTYAMPPDVGTIFLASITSVNQIGFGANSPMLSPGSIIDASGGSWRISYGGFCCYKDSTWVAGDGDNRNHFTLSYNMTYFNVGKYLLLSMVGFAKETRWTIEGGAPITGLGLLIRVTDDRNPINIYI